MEHRIRAWNYRASWDSVKKGYRGGFLHHPEFKTEYEAWEWLDNNYSRELGTIIIEDSDYHENLKQKIVYAPKSFRRF